MKIQFTSALVATLMALNNSALATNRVTLHVAPAGNDAWSGMLAISNATRTDGPVSSLNGAVVRIRELRAQSKDRPAALALIQAGEYPITTPLVLTSADSGISFEAATGARP
ncbi:MAG: hypothetical protein ABIP71_01070, partial [Verrucomicrobiota bacterium]